jgi:uncharacterized protein (DUF1501 family)
VTGLSRRRFLGIAGGTAGVALGGAAVWSRLVDEQVSEARQAPRRPGRILVVLEMAGGNDGLNTLVPTDGRYRDARPTLGVPERRLVDLEGETGYRLHPAVASWAPIWAAGRLAAVEGIGFGGQTRSHFAATDVWRAGGVWPFSTSWLGRWLDATGGDRARPLRAISLGADTRVLAAASSLSTVVTTPGSFNLYLPDGGAADAESVVAAFAATARPLSDDPLFAAVQTAIPVTLEAVEVLARATTAADPATVSDQDGHREATALLDTAARIIDLDIGAEVLVIGIDGFDTHAGQEETHNRLLTDVGRGITRFLDAMEAQGRADDVLVVTTSEFGRRVAENGSAGTDHGNGNVQFLFGTGVHGQIVGAPDLAHLDDGDLPVEIETRSLYAVALDWLGGPTDEILDGTFDRYDLLRG